MNELITIDHMAENKIISQRITDGYVNATALCKAAGKKINNYTRLATTKAFVLELSPVTGIRATGLIQQIQGGSSHLQGTWGTPSNCYKSCSMVIAQVP